LKPAIDAVATQPSRSNGCVRPRETKHSSFEALGANAKRLLRRALSAATRDELRTIGAAARTTALAVQRLSRQKNGSGRGELAVFRENDRVLIPGNFWNEPDVLPALRELKRHVGFSLFAVLYDLIPTRSPHFTGEIPSRIYTQALSEMAECVDGFFAISESSRRDMKTFCAERSLRAPPIETIRPGDDLVAASGAELPVTGIAPYSYVLAVGTLEARKNQMLLYYTWKEGLRRGIDLPKLVVVGRTSWSALVVERMLKDDPELRSRIVVLSEASDAELAWLLRNCLFALYPSFEEGFGLPIVEALRFGKVCLCSDGSSLPEAAGALGDYFSPFDPVGCLRLVEHFLSASNRERREREIRAWYRSVSWADTYRQLRQHLTNDEGFS
jgi:glycosyltransferase involved in cell wall biosynthesis